MNNLFKSLNYLVLLVLTSTLTVENATSQWTRFRGPNGQGIVKNETAPVTWDSTDYQWSITLPGVGNASPVAWEKTIFVTGADDEKNLGTLMAIDDREGKVLWQKDFYVPDLAMHNNNSLASPSPAVDASMVYIIWYSNEKTALRALDHDGNLRWEAYFDGIEARHGGGSSLVLTDDNIVFTREQEKGSTVKSSWVAVNKTNGKTAWELERESCERNSFSTPILVKNDNQKEQLIFTSQAHGFTGIDPETGEVLWENKDILTARVVSSPLYSDGLIFGSRKGQGMAIEVDLTEHQIADTATYTLPPNLSPYVPTPLVTGDLLFLFLDNGTVACVRWTTGELLWKERPSGPIYGSPIWVDGNIYCITKEGKVIVLAASPGYHLHGINDLGEGSFSTPILSGSGMVFRTFSKLMMLGTGLR